MTLSYSCTWCGATVEAEDLDAFGDAFIAHVRESHPEMPYSDTSVRNYAEATQRATGPTERLPELGEVTIHHVTEERIDDWLAFFDRDAFADNPAWADCYCAEPHVSVRGASAEEDDDDRTWQRNRATMIDLIGSGRSFGYLAYVDGRPAGWVNASKRSQYARYRGGDAAEPPDGDVIGVSCFVIAPPYRRHGLAERLLDQVIADAPGREVAWIEAYPASEDHSGDASNFHGPRSMFEARGFDPIEPRDKQTVYRRPAG